MKTFRNRLFLTYSIFIGTLLTIIGVLFLQLLPIFLSNTVDSISESRMENVLLHLDEAGIELSPGEREQLSQISIQTIDEQTIAYREMRLFLFLVLIGLFILFLTIGFQTFSKYAQPIDDVTTTAIELAKGNYKVRVPSVSYGNFDSLSTSINVLARNLQDISITRKIEEERLKTLIENMGSALMMIGREGNITVVNRSLISQFDFEYEDVINQPFRTAELPGEVVEFIDYIFMTEKSARKQIRIEYQQVKHMDIYGAPVIGDHGRWLGVVIVMHDITELVRLEQIRKDFVANVSHELKTPITSIKGFSETLLDGALDDRQTLYDFIKIIHKESERLQFLIQDLLELSKIEQHGFSVNMIKTNITDVINRSVEMVSQRIKEKKMVLEVNIEEDIEMMADRDRMIQIVMNLLANAVSYSPAETKITVNVYQNIWNLFIEVKDEGMGIDQQELPRIFERFYRVDRARSRNSGGTGLGLAIVKHLVEAHEGKITVDSTIGKGTTFKISIPKK